MNATWPSTCNSAASVTYQPASILRALRAGQNADSDREELHCLLANICQLEQLPAQVNPTKQFLKHTVILIIILAFSVYSLPVLKITDKIYILVPSVGSQNSYTFPKSLLVNAKMSLPILM